MSSRICCSKRRVFFSGKRSRVSKKNWVKRFDHEGLHHWIVWLHFVWKVCYVYRWNTLLFRMYNVANSLYSIFVVVIVVVVVVVVVVVKGVCGCNIDAQVCCCLFFLSAEISRSKTLCGSVNEWGAPLINVIIDCKDTCMTPTMYMYKTYATSLVPEPSQRSLTSDVCMDHLVLFFPWPSPCTSLMSCIESPVLLLSCHTSTCVEVVCLSSSTAGDPYMLYMYVWLYILKCIPGCLFPSNS